MKKSIAVLVVASVAAISSADLAVNLSNSGGTFTSDGSTFVDQALVQLVWNAGAPPSAPGLIDLSLSAPRDILLSQFTTTSAYAGTWSDLGDQGGIYANSDVGGSDISTGYLTLRVYEIAAPVFGTKYLQFEIDTDGILTVYDSLTASTVYQTEGTLGGNIGSSFWVIPEPSVFGMLGVAGMGIFLARRKARL